MNLSTSLIFFGVLQLALVRADCYLNQGPSPYEYDLDKLMDYLESTNNLVAGWRQYDDKPLYVGNFRVAEDVGDGKEIVRFPLDGTEFNGTITHVLSYDIATGYQHGTAYLVDGGIGFSHATIGFTYRPQDGLDHSVGIYGHYF